MRESALCNSGAEPCRREVRRHGRAPPARAADSGVQEQEGGRCNVESCGVRTTDSSPLPPCASVREGRLYPCRSVHRRGVPRSLLCQIPLKRFRRGSARFRECRRAACRRGCGCRLPAKPFRPFRKSGCRLWIRRVRRDASCPASNHNVRRGAGSLQHRRERF